MLGGPAPVSVSEVYQALATCPSGIKPRPTRDMADTMVCVPIEVGFRDLQNNLVFLPVLSWMLKPHMSREVREDTGEIKIEQQGCLRFMIGIPEGYRLVKDEPPPLPAVTFDPVTLEVDPLAFGAIPEFKGVDPAVFAFDPQRLAEIQREMNKKNAPGSGGGP